MPYKILILEKGLKLIKIYLSISKENQKLRFQFRKDHDLKYWKLSTNDWKAHKNWQLLTDYKEQMFEQTSTKIAPWVVINSDNKITPESSHNILTSKDRRSQ